MSIAKIKMVIIIGLKAEVNLKSPVYSHASDYSVGCIASSILYEFFCFESHQETITNVSETGEKSNVLSQAP
jgi:hypothetical protein